MSTRAQELPEGAELDRQGPSQPNRPGLPNTFVFHLASNRGDKVGEACSSKLVELLDRTGRLPFEGGIAWTCEGDEAVQRQDGFSMIPPEPEEPEKEA